MRETEKGCCFCAPIKRCFGYIFIYMRSEHVADVRPYGFGNEGTWRPLGVNTCVRFAQYPTGGHFQRHRYIFLCVIFACYFCDCCVFLRLLRVFASFAVFLLLHVFARMMRHTLSAMPSTCWCRWTDTDWTSLGTPAIAVCMRLCAPQAMHALPHAHLHGTDELGYLRVGVHPEGCCVVCVDARTKWLLCANS